MASNKTDTSREETKWLITGVSLSTRNAVKKAARKEGITIGEYVEKALKAFPKEATHVFPDTTDISNALLNLNDRLSNLEHKKSGKSNYKGQLKKLTQKIRWRDWLSKSQEAVQKAYKYTRKKVSGKKKSRRR